MTSEISSPLEGAVPVAPADWKLTPPWKGYALFGSGGYVLNHTPGPADPELGAEIVVTLATDKDRAGGRKIGESRDTDPNAAPIQPEDMVIRMGFLCPEAVDALEDQLIELRRENFPTTEPLAIRAAAPSHPPASADVAALLWIVEYGAIDLPAGDPSRVTCFECHESEEAAKAAIQAMEFNARMFAVAVPPHYGEKK